jgi:hypothetical protein
MTSICKPSNFGADPVNIKWNVVRGDTAKLRVEFLEEDEKTFVDTNGWIFEATAFNPKTESFDDLEISAYSGYVEVLADPDITEFWGTGILSKVAELSFDLQVTISNDVWTPIVGTISVIGDVTGARL